MKLFQKAMNEFLFAFGVMIQTFFGFPIISVVLKRERQIPTGYEFNMSDKKGRWGAHYKKQRAKKSDVCSDFYFV